MGKCKIILQYIYLHAHNLILVLYQFNHHRFLQGTVDCSDNYLQYLHSNFYIIIIFAVQIHTSLTITGSSKLFYILKVIGMIRTSVNFRIPSFYSTIAARSVKDFLNTAVHFIFRFTHRLYSILFILCCFRKEWNWWWGDTISILPYLLTGGVKS